MQTPTAIVYETTLGACVGPEPRCTYCGSPRVEHLKDEVRHRMPCSDFKCQRCNRYSTLVKRERASKSVV